MQPGSPMPESRKAFTCPLSLATESETLSPKRQNLTLITPNPKTLNPSNRRSLSKILNPKTNPES